MCVADGIIRNDPKHKFSEEHLEVLANIGTDIRCMLTVPMDINESDLAAKTLKQNMTTLRSMIVDLAGEVSSSPDTQIDHSDSCVDLGETDRGGFIAPKLVKGSHVCSLLFLQLAEHLALRSEKLYQSYKSCHLICQQAENLRASFIVNANNSISDRGDKV